MAYNGTTAGSTLMNPPILMAAGLGGRILNNGSTLGGAGAGAGAQFWLYASTDGCTAPTVANYFTDAKYIGMRAGDLVFGVFTTGASASIVIAILSSVTTNGANFLSTGSLISSTFN